MQRVGWFVRKLLSYLMLAVILLASVGFPISSNIHKLVLDEVNKNAEGALDSVHQVYHDWLHMMDEYTYQMKTTAKAGPYLMPSDGATALEITNLMKQTVTYSTEFETIAIVYAPRFFSTLPKLFTSMGTFDAQRFFMSQYRYDQWDLQDLYTSLPQMGTPSLRGPEWVTVQRATRAQYMTYIAPMSATSTRNNRGVMLFLTPAQRFLSMLASVNIPKDATLAVAGTDGQIQLASGNLSIPSDYILPDADGLQNSQTEVGNETCYLHQKEAEYGRRFVLLIPQSAVAALLQSRMWSVMLILMTGLVIAIAASVVLSTLAFRPVRRLKAIASAVHDDELKPINEFQQIENAITSLSESNTYLLSRMHSHSGMLMQHLLYSLCIGRAEQKEQFLALLEEEGIPFEESALRMVSIRIDNEDMFEERMDSSMQTLARYGLLKILRETVSKYAMTALGCETGEDRSIVALLSGAVADDQRVISVLEQLQQMAVVHFSLTLSIGVSGCFNGLGNVSEEYRRAIAAAEQRFTKGPGHIFIAHESTGHTEEANRHFMRLEARITGMLREEKYLDCLEQIDQYVQSVCSTDTVPAAARQLMTMLCASIHRQLQLAGTDVNVMARTVWRQYETIGQLRDALAAVMWELESNRRSSEEKQKMELIDRCMNYMQSHLSDPSLTMPALAEALQVPSGFLSRHFKAQIGVSPWQYFDELRMKHACALLKDTSLRVNEILTACGYVDKANFMRKFKRQFGMTPTEYRKANSQLPFEGSAANDDNGDEPEKENIQE